MVEEWKDIKGYEGIYKISNLGKVVRIKGSQEHPMKIWNNGRYMEIRLSKGGKSTHFTLHRLLAVHFIPNPNNLPFVNHIDEDKSNNKVENLEWCTNRYNCNYGTYNFRLSERLKGRKAFWLTKAVIQCSMNGEFIREFESIRDAAKAVKSSPANISMCCKGIYSSCKGFKWKLK